MGIDVLLPEATGGSKGANSGLRVSSETTVEDQIRQWEESQKLRSPFWYELQKGVSHQTCGCGDKTNKQAR